MRASGGRRTRLRPITCTQNKHLILSAINPILHYTLDAITEGGIKQIGIVHDAYSQEVLTNIDDGARWGVAITYIPQETPDGFAHTVSLGEKSIGDDFMFDLGDNMVLGRIKRFVGQFKG